MINKNLFLAIFTFCFMLMETASSLAQDFSSPEKTESKAGIGISVFNFDLFLYDYFDNYQPAGMISFPLNVGKKTRIEPEIGFASSPGYGAEYILSVNIGFLRMNRKNDFNLLYGMKTGFTMLDSPDDLWLSIGPILGGEHYFSKHFSIGAEIKLQGTYYDAWDDGFYLSTGTSFQARFYF